MEIVQRTFDQPDEMYDLPNGEMHLLRFGFEEVWRSHLRPGWSWETDLKPLAEGAESCPLTHREYVLAGRIRYVMDGGQEVEAAAGDTLFIPPGHKAEVVGDETCVLLDW